MVLDEYLSMRDLSPIDGSLEILSAGQAVVSLASTGAGIHESMISIIGIIGKAICVIDDSRCRQTMTIIVFSFHSQIQRIRKKLPMGLWRQYRHLKYLSPLLQT